MIPLPLIPSPSTRSCIKRHNVSTTAEEHGVSTGYETGVGGGVFISWQLTGLFNSTE